jgi:uncharacterized membrane protein YhaH (DUF805 family)
MELNRCEPICDQAVSKSDTGLVMPLLSLAANFPNRIGRAQWWLGIAVIGAIISGALALGGDRNALMMLGAAAVSLAIFIPITIARLHDRNHAVGTAFSCLVAAGVVAKLFRHTVAVEHRWWAIAAVAIAFAAWAVIELGILRGTVGRNPYGPDPVDESAETA